MREYLDKIVEIGNKEDMDCLGNMLIDMLENLKETDEKKYKHYKTKIMGMAHEYKIDKELAEEVVKSMKPLGEYWNLQTITNVIGEENYDIYVVMNSLANDYGTVIPLTDVETYKALTYAWINDVDGKEHKIWWYFVR